jgi:hypothetical protein
MYIFVQTALQAVQAPQLQHPAYWESLCSAAVEAYQKSGLAVVGALIQANQPPAVTLATIHDALSLLNAVCALDVPPARTRAVADLLGLLLGCLGVPEMAQIPPPQIAAGYSAAAHLSQTLQVPVDMRQMLDAFALDLRLAMPAQASTVVEMLPLPQLAMSQVDMSRPVPDNDIVVCGMLLRLLVRNSYCFLQDLPLR